MWLAVFQRRDPMQQEGVVSKNIAYTVSLVEAGKYSAQRQPEGSGRHPTELAGRRPATDLG
jgi:hypothetical protein